MGKLNNKEIDYKEEWKKLKGRMERLIVGFEGSSALQKGTMFYCKKYASGVLQGVVEYMDEVESNNRKEE